MRRRRRRRSHRQSWLGLIAAGAEDLGDVAQVERCLSERLGEVLQPDQLRRAADQLLRAVEAEGYSGAGALAASLRTCRSITPVLRLPDKTEGEI